MEMPTIDIAIQHQAQYHPDLKSSGTSNRMSTSFCLNAEAECLQRILSTSCSLEWREFLSSTTLSRLCISFQFLSILFFRSAYRSLMNSAFWFDRFSITTSSYSTSSSSCS